MPISMGIRTSGKTARQALYGLKGSVKDLDHVRVDFAEYMVTSVKRNFAAGGRPRRWKPSKRAIYTGGKTLIKSGRLKNSIFRRIRGDEIRVGTNVVYGRAHQRGVRKRVQQQVRAHLRRFGSRAIMIRAHQRNVAMNLPARPFLKIQTEDKRYLHKLLVRHLRGGK